MKQRTFKKAAAGVLSLALLAGSLSVGSDVFGNDIKASAADSRVATLNEASISLGGDMTYNFYLTVDSDDVSGLKVVIDGSHPLNGHKEYDLSTLTKEDGSYKVSFSTFATRMVKDVELKIVDAQGDNIDLKDSSGNDIADDIFHYDLAKYRNAALKYYEENPQADRNNGSDSAMVRATYNYCVFSAKYFGNITEIPTDENAPTELTRTIGTVPNWSVDNTKLTLNSVAFICDFETGLRYFFTTTNPEQDIQRAVYTYNDGSGAHEYEWKVVLRDASRNLYSVDVDNSTNSKFWDNPKKLTQTLDLKLVSDNNVDVGHIRLAPINVAKWCVDAANADNTEKPAEDCLNFGYAFANFANAAGNYTY